MKQPKVLVMKRKKEKFLIVLVKKLTVKSFLATVCCTESFDIRTTRDVYHGWCIFSTVVSILARFFVPTELKELCQEIYQ